MPKKKKPIGSRATLAANLRHMRLERNLSQEGLADLSSVERCERNATLDTIDKLSTALGIEPFQLLRETEE
jgi:transcriptional regulator with XRE-family HTH domain